MCSLIVTGADLNISIVLQQVLLPIIPQVCDIERMKQGGEHWQWSPETPFYVGVFPRRGAKPTDVMVYVSALASHNDFIDSFSGSGTKILFLVI